MTRSPNVREESTMAGPPDRLAERGQPSDSVRPPESDPVAAELRERMERLPPGHPSSPYNDDGSRKPPVPDPFEHDYPIPGDPDYQPDTPSGPETNQARDASGDDPRDHASEVSESGPDQELPPEDGARIDDHDSREQKERRLSQITDQAVARCSEAEGRDANGNYGERGLTPAMRRVESQIQHGKLVADTEKYALKSADRFKQKLVERINL